MSELVTGDAVVLDLQPARLASRAFAVGIDLVLVWAVYLLLSLALVMATASLDDAAVAAVAVGLFVLVLGGVPVAVETLSGGRSLGKLACGLRVVREDGGPVRFRHALVRGAVGMVELQLTVGVVACAASLLSARGRRLGDVFAGTLVVRERVPAGSAGRPGPVAPQPAWAAGAFAEADLSRVPDGLWLAVRQYLERAGQLDPGAGEAMARRLAGDLVAWTGAVPPAGVPAAVYLAGVVAERQAREVRRYARGDGGGAVRPPADVPGRAGAVRPPGGAGAGARPGAGAGTGGAAGGARDGGVPGAGGESRDGGGGGPARTGFVPPV